MQQLEMSGKGQREYAKGTRLLSEGNAQASVVHFVKAIRQRPRYYGPYHNLGMAYLQLGQFDAAEPNFQKAIDLSGGDYAPSIYGLAMVLYGKEQFAAAETLALRAFALQPTAGGKTCIGAIQLALGHLPDAERSARDAAELDPLLAETYFLLATIHDHQRNSAAAIADLQKYLKIAPRSTQAPGARALLERARQAAASNSASLP